MRAQRANINWTLDIGHWTFVFALCFALFVAPAFAAQQAAPYPAAFWINGTSSLNSGGHS